MQVIRTKQRDHTLLCTNSNALFDASIRSTEAITGFSRGITMSLSISISDATSEEWNGNTLRRMPINTVSQYGYNRRLNLPDTSTCKAIDFSSAASLPFPFVRPFSA